MDLFDEAGIGGGASGVSGGLLHPYTPKGKLLWKGNEGWHAALNLLAAAEAATPLPTRDSNPIAWRRGILRPLVAEKHVKDARKLPCGNGQQAGIRCLERPMAQAMVPGLELPELGLGLYIPEGINLHPRSYLDALWLACENFAHNAGAGTRATLVNQHVSSLAELAREGYEAVVVCTGSKAVLLPELAGKLPLTMCRGVVAHLELPDEYEEYRSQAPNLLSHTWLAVQGARKMVLGATKDWNSGSECGGVSAEEGILVQDELVQRAAQFYPLIKQWEVKTLRAGVRAMPPRTPLGALPLAGLMPSGSSLLSNRSLDLTVFYAFQFLSNGTLHHNTCISFSRTINVLLLVLPSVICANGLSIVGLSIFNMCNQ